MPNPVFARRVESIVSNGLADAFLQIEGYVRNGYGTNEDVRDALALCWGDVMLEDWDDWLNEGFAE